MIWGFVILGVVVSVPALEGLFRELLGGRPRTWRWNTLVLLLIVGAWFAGHRTFTGWATLIAAALLQAAILRSDRKAVLAKPDAGAAVNGSPPETPDNKAAPDVPATETAVTAKPPDDAVESVAPPPKDADTPPPPPEQPTRTYSTRVLLASPCEVAAEVFFASLRRGGLREAELLPTPDGGRTVRIQAGEITLELTREAGKTDHAELNRAASQSWDWPEAAAVAANHAASVSALTRASDRAQRAQIVHLHRRAQTALGEFAPVLAVYWPGAWRLTPPSRPAAPSGGEEAEPAPTSLCVNFRMFPPPEGEAGPFVSDSVGLHAFGLPDVEISGDREPDDAVSAVLYQVVERIFAEGCEIKNDEVLDLAELGAWRAVHGRSKFDPDRQVIELTALNSES